jgi:hypothetical protein
MFSCLVDYYNQPVGLAPAVSPITSQSSAAQHGTLRDPSEEEALPAFALSGADAKESGQGNEGMLRSDNVHHQMDLYLEPAGAAACGVGQHRGIAAAARADEELEAVVPTAQPPPVMQESVAPVPPTVVHLSWTAPSVGHVTTPVPPGSRQGSEEAAVPLRRVAEKELGGVLEGVEALLRGSTGTGESDDLSAQEFRDARRKGEVSEGTGWMDTHVQSAPSSAVQVPSSAPTRAPARKPGIRAARSTPASSSGPSTSRVAAVHAPDTQQDLECGVPAAPADARLSPGKTSPERPAGPRAALTSGDFTCFRDETEPHQSDRNNSTAAARSEVLLRHGRGRASTDEEEGKVGYEDLEGFQAVDGGQESRAGYRQQGGEVYGTRHRRYRTSAGSSCSEGRKGWEQFTGSCAVS